MFSRLFTRNITRIPKTRMFSCQYYNDKPFLAPFTSSFLCGTIFTSLILGRIESNDTQLIRKLYEIEKDIKNKDINNLPQCKNGEK